MKTYLKYGLLATITLVIVVAAVWSGLNVPARAVGASYYVDCSAGSNGSGTQSSPWNNLATVNGTTFAAGDSILFKRGATCSGTLWPKGSGASGSPITISAYGTGALPIINGGTNEEAIKLSDQEYWTISNVETTGGTTFGIFVTGSGTSVLHAIHITNAVVHDVTGGAMPVKTTGLIVIGYDWTQQFDDVLVEGVTAYNTTLWSGIVVTGKGYKWQTTRSNNVTIRNCTVHDTYGDGIIVFSAQNVLIESNVSWETGNEPTETIGTPNAIWTWDCSYCVLQFNEASLAASPSWDGGAFDIDYYSSYTTLQYNYGHDNDAYCMAMFATDGVSVLNSTMRYNVCSNNARDAALAADRNADLYFAVWLNGRGGYIQDNSIYNNTFYWNPANPSGHYAFAAYDLWRGVDFSGVNRIMNNILYSDNPNLVKMAIKAGVVFDNNLYWYTGAGSPSFVWGHSSYSSFSAFQSGSGQEAHGVYADPLLNDSRYHADGMPVTSFTLQSGSPAINAGANLGSMGARDFFGNAIPANGAYDIGAAEYGGAPVPTATPTSTPGGPTSTPVPPTATPTPGGTEMHVFDIYTTDAAGNPKTVFVAGSGPVYWRVKIVDTSNNPVSGASVTCDVNRPGGTWATVTQVTGADGWALFSKTTQKQNTKGSYSITVTGVTKSGWTYNSAANVKSSCQFTLQ